MTKPKVIIIGGGFTGVATAHDLALRGCDVTVVERGEIGSGTSGRTHGLLHSGARYAVTDPESAKECIVENAILRRIVPQVIEPNGGLFVGLDDADLAYAPQFEMGCQACQIPIERLAPGQALQIEPNLNPKVQVAYRVPDGSFDPLRLAFAFAATAKKNGAFFLTYTEVKDFIINGQGCAAGVRIWDRATDRQYELCGDIVVNATGAWVGELISKMGGHVPVQPTPGVMVAFDQRLVQRPINRLNLPDDGDIVLPQRRMVVVGTTSYQVTDLDYVPVEKDQVEMMVKRGSELVPGICKAGKRGVYCSTRPLIGKESASRSLTRTFECFDHQQTDGIAGLVSITGGKATTLRAMAETTADVVCNRLGIQAPCLTRDIPLLSYRAYFTD